MSKILKQQSSEHDINLKPLRLKLILLTQSECPVTQ